MSISSREKSSFFPSTLRTTHASKTRSSIVSYSPTTVSELQRLANDSTNFQFRRPFLLNRIFSLRIMLLTYVLLFSVIAYLVAAVQRGPNYVSRLAVESGHPYQDIILRGVNPGNLGMVPLFFNRFNVPWYLPPRVQHRSLSHSRNRILYSTLRERAGDGIGHAFGTMNAEVNAAFRLGLTYTHRVATYGSLTRGDDMTVENLFGWGHDEIPRNFIRESFCNSTYDGMNSAVCQVCRSVRRNDSVVNVHFDDVIEIPDNLTYTRGWCGLAKSEACQRYLHEFLQNHDNPNTIFQMPVTRCDQSPVDSYIDEISRAFFFHKYWDHHGHTREGQTAEDGIRQVKRRDGIPRLSAVRRRKPRNFREDELIVTIHARRGDFFDVKRKMISVEAFGRVLRQTMRVVMEEGGIFSKLPVSVHIYSEGTKKKGVKNMGHDISLMTKQFVDSDGTVRDEEWIVHALMNGTDERSQGEGMKDERLFRNGLRVTLHVATSTVDALHDMISSDVFIGSHSALGKHIVSTLSRGGVHFMPYLIASFENECCHASFQGDTGMIEDLEKVKRFWKAYVTVNEKSTARAYYMTALSRALGLKAEREKQLRSKV